MSEEQDQVAQRKQALQELKDQGTNPFAIHSFDRTHTSVQAVERIETIEEEAGGPEEVDWNEAGFECRVAGRLMAVRDQGKSIWADLQDGWGQIQLWARQDELGDEQLEGFRNLDIGDIIGVEGSAFRTRRGEPTVRAQSYILLSKALRPLPEKFHGLQDVELRYRRRYLDLMVNEEVREIFQKRSAIIQALRRYFDDRDFTEVTTPMMQPLYGGAAARPFTTYHNALDMDLYLRIAPELYLKRLVVGGMERVYEIGRVFRNEGVDASHNPEFTLLEAYQAYADYEDMMNLVEELVCQAALAVEGSLQFTYQDHEIDLTPPWRRISLLESIEQACGVDFSTIETDEDARDACEGLSLGEMEGDSRGALMEKCFDRFVEPDLIQPTFVIDYPVAVSPLAKRKPDEPGLTARFEPFIAGAAVGHAFSELNDPEDQRQRFEEQVRARMAGDEEAHPLDEDFLLSLEYGLPPTGGMGLGVDRLVMLLTDTTNLREVILFPHMRPEEG